MPTRMKAALTLFLLSIAAASLGAFFHNRGGAESNVIYVSGNIEVTDAEVSFKIAGRLDKRVASEGQLIQRGDLVALLDTAELESQVAMRNAELASAKAVLAELEAGARPEEIAEAEAALDRARAALAELEAGSRPQEIAVAEAAVASARADLGEAEATYDRIKGLYERSMAAEQEYVSARARRDVARARLDEVEERLKLVREGPRSEQITAARAAVEQAEQHCKLVRQGPRREAIDQARAKVEQAAAAVRLAQTQLDYARLVSPLSGLVLSQNVEDGEYVAPGTPVVTVGDLEHPWLRAYINETDLGRVKVGQKVRVTTDSYDDKVYEGRVSFISGQAEFTPKNVQTNKERVKLVYRIKIEIANPNMELKPGMPADAEIELDAK